MAHPGLAHSGPPHSGDRPAEGSGTDPDQAAPAVPTEPPGPAAEREGKQTARTGAVTPEPAEREGEPTAATGSVLSKAPDPATDTAVLETEPDPEPRAAAGRGPRERRARRAFRRWRRSRPFWGGVFVVLGGAEITFTEKAPFTVVVHVGLYGLAGYLLPIILILCGLLILFNPQQRTFYSVLSVLLSLGTWLTSNLGGFVIGMLLGIVGGSLAFGWVPGERPPRTHRSRRTRGRPVGHGDLTS